MQSATACSLELQQFTRTKEIKIKSFTFEGVEACEKAARSTSERIENLSGETEDKSRAAAARAALAAALDTIGPATAPYLPPRRVPPSVPVASSSADANLPVGAKLLSTAAVFSALSEAEGRAFCNHWLPRWRSCFKKIIHFRLKNLSPTLTERFFRIAQQSS